MVFIKAILLFTLINFAWAFSTKREVGDPQQECIEECKRESKSTNCEKSKSCTVLTPMERHVTPLLEANCVKECNGGDVTAENPLKPECEQQCLFKEPSPVLKKRAAENEEPGCKTECTPMADGKGKECKTTCTGKTGGIGGRMSGPLNKTCVDECNGGVMPTKLEELKPGCEEKCAFKGPIVVYQKKTEFASKEACLQYCQEKGLGHSEDECNQKCQHTFSGMVQG